MKTKSIIFTLLTLIHVSGWSSDKIVKIATLTGYPPFCFDEPAGTASVSNSIPPGMDAKSFKGISWDVVRESFAAVDYTIQLELVPWVRVMNYLENNQVDLCFPAVKTDGRGELYYFSKNPVDRQQFVIYVRKDSPLQWDGLKSLSGLTIGTMREWSFGQRFETADFFKKVSNTEIIIGLQNLNLGRVDGVVGYEISYDYELTKAGMLNVFKKLPPFDYSDEFMMGLKNNTKSKLLLDEFDRGYEVIQKNGILQSVKAKWKISNANN